MWLSSPVAHLVLPPSSVSDRLKTSSASWKTHRFAAGWVWCNPPRRFIKCMCVRACSQLELDILPEHFIPVRYTSETDYASIVGRILPTLLIIGALFFFSGQLARGGAGGGMSNVFKIGKANPSTLKDTASDITFADVAGCDEAKVWPCAKPCLPCPLCSCPLCCAVLCCTGCAVLCCAVLCCVSTCCFLSA